MMSVTKNLMTNMESMITATRTQSMQTRGGRREGAGKKPTGPIKIKVAYSLAPDVVEYLRSITYKPQAQVIEEALRDHREKHKGANENV